MAARTSSVRARRESWESSRFAPSTNSRPISLPSQEHWVWRERTSCQIPRNRLPLSRGPSNPDQRTAQREQHPAWFAHTVYQRVREKLRREPVEDYRIDFEDGYGSRPDQEEDGHALAAAAELASAMNEGELPAFIGIRIKPLTEELRHRSIRTLDLFLTELAGKTRGELPRDFRITLPKVTLPDEVAALADICSRLEPALDLSPGACASS